jgi:error-prone DNA polymerase
MLAELHLHTCYSFLDGASHPEELAGTAAALGYEALAVTDHDGLHGAMAFAQACRVVGIKPITGVELTLRHGLVDAGLGPVHLTLLAEDARGYANLCRLVTQAHRTSPLRADRGPGEGVSLDPAFLEGRTAGVVALSGCRLGEAARLLDAGRPADAAAALRRLADLFGCGSTFVELQHNLVKGDTARAARLAELAGRLELPTVATGNVHYHARARHRLQDALVAVRHRSTLEGSHRVRRPNDGFHLRRPEETAALFAVYPEAVANAGRIAERCAFDLSAPGALPYVFPDFTRKEGEEGVPADEVLARHCRAAFAWRYPAEGTDPAVRARAAAQLEAELRLIASHRLSGFFLIYRDLQELATEVAREVRGAGTVRGGSGLPPGRGRGSSVSSIVCFLIGLSHVDPIRTRLHFRRFINEDLTSVPDIDLDFARDIRERLILAVYERYGHDHAALVCTFATYHLRSAVRDLGKALGLPADAVDAVAKLAEGGIGNLSAELPKLPGFADRAQGPLWRLLVELAVQVEGMPRHLSQHPGGMVISSRPLIDLVPVQPAAMAGRFVCQWDKDAVDDARFIKIDFLGLAMLSVVEDCLEQVWRNRGERVDLGAIPYDDPDVYDQICAGDTVGVFQIGSRAQIQTLARTQPRTLDELAVQVAIVRPGPIVGGAVNPYVERRQRRREDPMYAPPSDHPLLDEPLRDTLGVILYQDQVLEVAVAMGGFRAGEADGLRRALSRKRSHEAIESFRTRFLQGAALKGVDPETARLVFDKISAFSGYGFPKSHAYAFGALAYQSAWLRRYHPVEFHAALLSNQPMGFYAPHVLVGDARRHGVPTLRPSINASAVRSQARGDAVLLGLSAVRGVSEALAGGVVAERDANGPYRTLGGLLRRTGLPRPVAENLAAVGALSAFGLSRRELLWQLGLLLPTPRGAVPLAATADADGRPRQAPLELPTGQDMALLPEMTDWERMVADYGLLELSPSYHPMALLRPRVPPGVLTAAQVAAAPDGARVRTAGLVVCRQRPGTAKGVVFLSLEDETGLCNAIVWPGVYARTRSTVRAEPYLVVEGVVQRRSGAHNVVVSGVRPLERVPGGLLPAPHLPHAYPPAGPDAPLSARPAGEAERTAGAPDAAVAEARAVAPAAHSFR